MNTTKPNFAPPNTKSSVSCHHKWMHLDTKKYYDVRDYTHKYVRIDNFYCENCGEIMTKKKEDYSREEPDWY